MSVDTMTRQQMIAHLGSVAKNWGIPKPTITARTSDQALRKCVRRLFKDGERLGRAQ